MILVLKYIQNFIKIYKTLAGALTHTRALGMHLICDKSSTGLKSSQFEQQTVGK